MCGSSWPSRRPRAGELQAPAVDSQTGELAGAVERRLHDAVVQACRVSRHRLVAAGRLGQRRGAERRQVQEQIALGQVHATVDGCRVERDGIAAVRQLGRRGLLFAGQDEGELRLQVVVHAGDRAAGKRVVELPEQHAQPRLLAERPAAVGHAQRLVGLQRHLACAVEPLVLGLRGQHAAMRFHVELALVDRQAVADPLKLGEERGAGPPGVARGAGEVPEAPRALGLRLARAAASVAQAGADQERVMDVELTVAAERPAVLFQTDLAVVAGGGQVGDDLALGVAAAPHEAAVREPRHL